MHRQNFTPQKDLLVLISVRDWVDPRVIVRLEELGKLKTIQWFEHAIFRLVGWSLNHLRYRVPQRILQGPPKLQPVQQLRVVSSTMGETTNYFYCHVCVHLVRQLGIYHILSKPPWSWAFLERPPVVQLLKNFQALYWIRWFTTVFTKALLWSLCWASSIQPIPPLSLHDPS
jgi:hypothetical protein